MSAAPTPEMEEYAKKVALDFYEFKATYRHIESMNVRHENMRLFGDPIAATWIGASDEAIWEAYKKGEQLKRYFER